MDAEAAARAWIAGWTRGWSEHDAAAIAALYAEDARFRSQPFREAKVGPAGVREYAEWAFSDEDEVEFRFGAPVVGGDRAAVEYWAIITSQGRTQTLFGVAVIRFGADGRVVDQRDYWAMEDGRRSPWEGWGA